MPVADETAAERRRRLARERTEKRRRDRRRRQPRQPDADTVAGHLWQAVLEATGTVEGAAKKAQVRPALAKRGNRPGGPTGAAGEPPRRPAQGGEFTAAALIAQRARELGLDTQAYQFEHPELADYSASDWLHVGEKTADVITGIPSLIRDPSWENAGWAALGVIPVGRVGSIGARTAIKAGRTIARPAIRTLRFGDLVVNPYTSPSHPTALAQGVFDRISERFAGAPIIGSAARVPKRAGQGIARDRGREVAFRATDIKALRKVRSTPQQVAHFWWHQLPPEYQNEAGLKMLRDKFAQLEKEAMKGGAAEHAIIAADLDTLVKELDSAIGKGVKRDEGILEAIRNLMADREGILSAAGKLSDEVAGAREGLLPHWLGVEGKGGYAGHRLLEGRDMGAIPPSTGLGKARNVKGLQKNQLVLLEKGRLRRDLDVFIEDWQDAQRFAFAAKAKADLAAMGEAITGLPKRDYVIVNPKGRMVPQAWKVARDPDNPLVNDFEGIVAHYGGEGIRPAAVLDDIPADEWTQAERVWRAAEEAGELSDLRQIPLDVYHRYVSRAARGGVISSNPAVRKSMRTIGKGFDVVNDLQYLAMIYANPGYIPANLLGNLVMAGLHTTALLPVNLFQSGQVLLTGPKRLRKMLLNEVGQGATVSVASTNITKKIAGVIGGAPDNWPRVSVFLHEAKMRGVIPYWKPILTNTDYDKLTAFIRDPKSKEILNAVSDTAQEAMVRFDRMSPLEQSFARRILFVWPWIRGATAYPFRFALDHPVRSGLLAYLAAEGVPGTDIDLDDVQSLRDFENIPYLKNAYRVGETVVNGEPFSTYMNTQSFSPISTPLDMLGTLTGQKDARTFTEMLNPLLRFGWQVGSKENAYGGEADSYREALLSNAPRLAPIAGLIGDVAGINEPSELYPEDATWQGRMKRASRVLPVAVDPEVAAQVGARYEDKPKRTFTAAQKDAQFIRNHPESVHRDYVPFAVNWRKADDQIRTWEKTLAEEENLAGVSKLSDRQRYRIRLEVLIESRPDLFPDPEQSRQAFDEWFDYAAKAPPSQREDILRDYKEKINDLLEFEDILGHRISWVAEQARDQWKDRNREALVAG